MAKLELITALRTTADRVADAPDFQWTHNGRCTCGHLAQVVTGRTAAEIHALALEKKGDDWGEHAMATCEVSGMPFDYVLADLFALGLKPRDIGDLERLRNRDVRARLGRREMDYRNPEDVTAYLHGWADLLEERSATCV